MVQKLFFESFDGKNICWRKLDTGNQTGRALVLFHGLGQDYFHYMNLFSTDSEYSSWFDTIYAIDFRGHGDSYKKYQDRVYFGEFSDVIQDAQIWIKNIVVPQSNGKQLFLFGHSFGGAVALPILSKNPEVFKKAILSAPCIDTKLGPLEILDFDFLVKKKIPTPYFVAKMMEIPVRIFGLEEKPIANEFVWKTLTQWDVPYDKAIGPAKYDIRDRQFYEMSMNHYREVNLHRSGMYNLSNKAAMTLLRTKEFGSRHSKNIKTETLCFLSEYDYFVYNDYAIELFKRNKNIRTFVVEGSESHNVFMDSQRSSDLIRNEMRKFVL